MIADFCDTTLTVHLMIGTILLLFGRRLFWLFVGCIGFVAGMAWANNLFQSQPEWMALSVGLFLGLVGAMLALLIQKVAVALAGLLAGGYLAHTLLQWAPAPNDSWALAIVMISAVAGAIVLFALFDWALITLSALVGSALVAGALEVERTAQVLLLILLFLAGSAFQVALMRRRSERAHRANC